MKYGDKNGSSAIVLIRQTEVSRVILGTELGNQHLTSDPKVSVHKFSIIMKSHVQAAKTLKILELKILRVGCFGVVGFFEQGRGFAIIRSLEQLDGDITEERIQELKIHTRIKDQA